MEEMEEFETDIIITAVIKSKLRAPDAQEAKKQLFAQMDIIRDKLLKMANMHPAELTIKFDNFKEIT